MVNAWQNVIVDYILKSMLLYKQFRMNLTCVHSACVDSIDREMRGTWCQPESEMVYQLFPELQHFTENASDVVGRFLRNFQDCPYETVSATFFRLTVCRCEYMTLDCQKVSQFKTVIWLKIRGNLFCAYQLAVMIVEKNGRKTHWLKPGFKSRRYIRNALRFCNRRSDRVRRVLFWLSGSGNEWILYSWWTI